MLVVSPNLNAKLLEQLSWGNWVYLPVAVFVFFIVRSIKRRYFNGLTSIPGPWLASVTRAWRVNEVFAGHTERTELELHRKYSPNEVTTNDPKAVELLYSISSKFPKTDFYRLFGFPDVYGIHQFSVLDNALHNKLSRHTSAAFAMTSIVELEQYVDSSVEYLVTRIQELGTKGIPMNMAQWFQWYAFDVIGELTLSKRFGFMKYAKDVDDSTKLIDTILWYTSVVGQAFTYHWLLLGNPLLKLFVSPPTGELINMAVREVKERQGRSTDRRDLLSRFLKSHEKDPVGFSMDQLFRTCTMVIGAGSDTTGIALTGTLYHLLKNPGAYKRLKDEIDEAEKNKTLSRSAKLRETQPLPYLQAVIKEGMRVHPSVAFILPRHVPEGGCTIAGKFLPAGVSFLSVSCI
ncbi:hypothetical protein CLAIMM_09941 isoform 1 [Cladophialophora immunda]|nr:hypothetical protein CLAIMM_09941 isoform 1 [Cladophialophora immunda]